MDIDSIYKLTKDLFSSDQWDMIKSRAENDALRFKQIAEDLKNEFEGRVIDIIRTESALHETETASAPDINSSDDYIVNSSLNILSVTPGTAELLQERGLTISGPIKTVENREYLLIWKDRSGKLQIKTADELELLVLKVVLKEIKPGVIVNETKEMTLSDLNTLVYRTSSSDIVLKPETNIKRNVADFPFARDLEQLAVSVFTLQWHITNKCDLHCLHCYDREKRVNITLSDKKKVLDELESFSRIKRVRPSVCFSGGNPFMSKDFKEIYAIASQKGFSLSILGNPVSETELDSIAEIQRPGFFQVSLEGMEKTNDSIRGKGYFSRVIDFLAMLKSRDIESSVMLTLAEYNMGEVLELADFLEDKTDYFTFNRLSGVGMAKDLTLADKQLYISFLKKYIKAAQTNSILGFKDNLINRELFEQGLAMFDGCTGYGCGAAFNFLALLPDGEIHACRKFPSRIGNIKEAGLSDIYDGAEAARYRQRPEECRLCRISHLCGSCLAVTYSSGNDISLKKDIYCKSRI